jgi:integrase
MIRWATTVREPDGTWLLSENPLRGYVLPREASPRRPLASFDRFLKVREAIGATIAEATEDSERDKWHRLDLALVLAEATGRRIGSIRGLRWDDMLTEPSRIRWVAAFDKKRRESVVPVPDTLAQTVREFRAQLRAWSDGWLFPKLDGEGPWATAYLAELLRAAEKKAKLTPLLGGLWHCYRRKWATERKHLPLADVKEAGGWKDTETLLRCYQAPDEEGMLAVLSAPQKLREKRA